MNDDRYVTGIDFASPLGDYEAQRRDERDADRYDATRWVMDAIGRRQRRMEEEILSGMSAGLAGLAQASEQIYRHIWTASGPYRDRAREQAVNYDPPNTRTYTSSLSANDAVASGDVDRPNCRCELDDPVISPDVFEAEFRVVETRRLDP